MDKNCEFAIIGGGIGGLTTALCLEHFGFSKYKIFEQAPEFGEVGAAISCWPNALMVYQEIGIYDDLKPFWGEIKEAYIRTSKGKLLQRFVPQYELPAVCIHRADLHKVLYNALPQQKLFKGYKLKSIFKGSDGIELAFENGKKVTTQYVIGADGLNSVVRQNIFDSKKPVYRGYNIWRGIAHVKEDYQGAGGETWGKGARVGIVPIRDGEIGWWATLNERQEESDEPEGTLAKLNRVYGKWPDPIPHLINNSPQILKNSIFDRRPSREWNKNGIVLMGDAAHPTTPNLGQGGCMAIEGAYLLAACLEKYPDFEQATNRYEEMHYPRTKSVTRQSLLNGIMGQWENSALRILRNTIMGLIPQKKASAILDTYFDYDVTRAHI